MALRERLAHAPKGRGHSCSIGILIATWPINHSNEEAATLSTKDYQALLAALADPDWAAPALTAALTDEGHRVNPRHVQQHRRGGCASGNCPVPQLGVLP